MRSGGRRVHAPSAQPPSSSGGGGRVDVAATPSAGGSPLTLVLALVLGFATFAVYATVRHFEFVLYDDLSYVPETPQVAAGLRWSGILWALRSGALANWHPLTWMSHMLDVQIFGLDAGGHHLTSLLLHVMNTVLVLVVFTRMTGSVWPSALAAGLFGLHPLHVESVAWVAERKDVLSTCCLLLMLLAYAHHAARPGLSRYLGVLALFALGLMAKPMLVTAPFLLLLLDFWPLGRYGRTGSKRPSVWPQASSPWTGEADLRAYARALPALVAEKIPLFCLAAASSIVTFVVQSRAGAVAAIDRYPLDTRLANAVMSYGRYLLKTVWPVDLAVFYPYPSSRAAWQVAGVGALLALATLGAVAAVRRRPYLLVGWLWFVGSLVPVIGIVQVGMQSMADRYMYIPSIGLFIAAAWALEELVLPWRSVLPARIAGGVALAALGVLTAGQVRVWQNTFTLFEHTLRTTTANPVAHNILGLALVRTGRIDEGIQHFTQALAIKPHHSTHFNLGLALAMRGRFDEAIEHDRDALADDPSNPKTLSNLGDALFHQGKLPEAQTAYEASLRVQPAQVPVLTNLGACLDEQHRTAEAVEVYRQVLRLDPSHAEALNNLGVALATLGKTEEAMARYADAVRVKPDYADAHRNLANLLLSLGRGAEAVTHYEAVLRENPHDETAQAGLRRARLSLR